MTQNHNTKVWFGDTKRPRWINISIIIFLPTSLESKPITQNADESRAKNKSAPFKHNNASWAYQTAFFVFKHSTRLCTNCFSNFAFRQEKRSRCKSQIHHNSVSTNFNRPKLNNFITNFIPKKNQNFYAIIINKHLIQISMKEISKMDYRNEYNFIRKREYCFKSN